MSSVKGVASRRSRERNQIVINFVLLIALQLMLFAAFGAGHWRGNADLTSYATAQQLFLSGGDPYSAAELVAWRKLLDPSFTGTAPVWNPPILFVTIGWMFSAPFAYLPMLFSTASTIAFAIVLLIGTSLRLGRSITSPLIFPLGMALCPIVVLSSIKGQWSTILVGCFAMGLLLFQRRRDFIAGAILALCILKPHVTFLPCIALALVILAERRFKVILGAAAMLLVTTFLSELINPGIFWKWLGREAWPTDYIGSTGSSLIRAGLTSKFGIIAKWPVIVVSLLGMTVISFQTLRASHPKARLYAIMLACVLNPIFAPFGFMYDQTIALLPIGFILAGLIDPSRSQKNSFHLRLLAGIGLLALWVGFVASTMRSLFDLPLFWFVYPVFLLSFGVLLLELDKKTNVSSN